MWCTGLVAPRHVGSSRTRARTRVPCIGRWILNHCSTREALCLNFLSLCLPSSSDGSTSDDILFFSLPGDSNRKILGTYPALARGYNRRGSEACFPNSDTVCQRKSALPGRTSITSGEVVGYIIFLIFSLLPSLSFFLFLSLFIKTSTL